MIYRNERFLAAHTTSGFYMHLFIRLFHSDNDG